MMGTWSAEGSGDDFRIMVNSVMLDRHTSQCREYSVELSLSWMIVYVSRRH